jgi:hypothetical protein
LIHTLLAYWRSLLTGEEKKSVLRRDAAYSFLS